MITLFYEYSQLTYAKQLRTVTLHNKVQVVTISLIGTCLEKDMAYIDTAVFVFLTLVTLGQGISKYHSITNYFRGAGMTQW